MSNVMDSAEANHVLAFSAMVPLTVLYSVGNSLAFLPWMVLLNVVGNLYPVLVQRMNRLRVTRLLGRAGRPY